MIKDFLCKYRRKISDQGEIQNYSRWGSSMLFQQIRGATSIVTFHGVRFLIDPFFAPKDTFPPVPSPYNEFKNPMVPLPLEVEELIKVQATIVTHMHHFDHFDPFAAEALPKDMPMFTQSETEANDMRALGFKNVTALTEAGVNFKGVTLHRTPALHGDGVTAAYYYKKFSLPSETCGVVFQAEDEKTFYVAGDTLWFSGVEQSIKQYQPKVIALNAANAQMYDGTPILMGAEGLEEVALAAPDAVLIGTHLDAVNHARVGRKELKAYAQAHNLMDRLYLPEDGEILNLA